MPQILRPTCTACGAPLDFLPGTLAVRCLSCGATVHVRDNAGNAEARGLPQGDRRTRAEPEELDRPTQPSVHPAVRYEALVVEIARTREQLDRLPLFSTVGFFAFMCGFCAACYGYTEAQTGGVEPQEVLVGIVGLLLVFVLAPYSALRNSRKRRTLLRELGELESRAAALGSMLGLPPGVPGAQAPPSKEEWANMTWDERARARIQQAKMGGRRW